MIGAPSKKSSRVIIYNISCILQRWGINENSLRAKCRNEQRQVRQQIKLISKIDNRKKIDIIGYWKHQKRHKYFLSRRKSSILMELLQNPGLPDGDEVVLDSYKCHNFGHTAKYCQKKRKSANIAQRTQIAKGMFLKTIPTKNLVIITREAKSESHIESDPIKDELWPIKTLKTDANYVYLSWDRSVSPSRLCGLWIRKASTFCSCRSHIIPKENSSGLNGMLVISGKPGTVILAGIAVRNPMMLAHLCDDHCVYMEMIGIFDRIYLTSIYFQCSGSVKSYFRKIEGIISALPGKK